jgi:hypothetical protein
MRLKLQILSIFIFLTSFSRLIAQDIITIVDSSILSIYKENHKCKRIKIGNRRTGTVYWFLRKNKNMFAIELRKEFKTGKKFDSSITHHYYYKEDILIKATCEKHSHLKGKPNWGIKHLYFEKDKLVNQLSYRVAPDLDIIEIVKEAYAELKKGYDYRNDD